MPPLHVHTPVGPPWVGAVVSLAILLLPAAVPHIAKSARHLLKPRKCPLCLGVGNNVCTAPQCHNPQMHSLGPDRWHFCVFDFKSVANLPSLHPPFLVGIIRDSCYGFHDGNHVGFYASAAIGSSSVATARVVVNKAAYSQVRPYVDALSAAVAVANFVLPVKLQACLTTGFTNCLRIEVGAVQGILQKSLFVCAAL